MAKKKITKAQKKSSKGFGRGASKNALQGTAALSRNLSGVGGA